MITGIGIDIVEVERIQNAIEKNPRFLSRNFTEKEIEYFTLKGNKYTSIAGNFAAKEAISKTLGTGFRTFSLSDIEILRDDLGKPIVNLYNNAKILSLELGIKQMMVSISHTHVYAVANCVGIKGE